MFRVTHILAAGLSCILLISEIATADPGPCPDFPHKSVDWNNISKKSPLESLPGPSFLPVSYVWKPNLKVKDEYRCHFNYVPPIPDNLNNYVQQVLGTDNEHFAVIMECNGNDHGHNKTIRTYAKNFRLEEPVLDAVKAVHVANGFGLEYFGECIWISD